MALGSEVFPSLCALIKAVRDNITCTRSQKSNPNDGDRVVQFGNRPASDSGASEVSCPVSDFLQYFCRTAQYQGISKSINDFWHTFLVRNSQISHVRISLPSTATSTLSFVLGPTIQSLSRSSPHHHYPHALFFHCRSTGARDPNRCPL
jgi:hypothetical protein